MKKISVFAVCICMLTAVGCSKSLKVTVKENVELEYGEKPNNSLLFDKEQSDEDVTVKEVKNFDSKKTGEQEITVVFTNADEKTKEETLNVTVKDTKKPVIKLKKDKLEITEGDKFDAAANIESVKDPIDGDIKKSDDKKLTKNGYLITSDVNANKAGSYTVKITAFDVNGNKAESSYKVTVKAKPQEPVAQQPTYQTSNQSSGNSGYANNQGSAASNNSAPAVNNSSSSNQTAQSKPQQTCKAGYVHPNQIGNSGKIFDSEQEAIEYGKKIDAESNNTVGFAYIQLLDDCDNLLNKWTVDFNYVGQYENGFVK